MDNRDLVKRQFGAHAQNYVVSTDHSTGDSLERLLAEVAFQANWRALDIATGGGHTALAVAPHVRAVVATDLTAEMLAAAERFIQAQGQANVTFQEADATALPFGPNEFDLVTCRIAPHHFPDCAQFVREMARVLVPGGLAVLIDNSVPGDQTATRHINAFEKLRDPSHHWAHTEADWLDFFAAAGLAVQHREAFRKVRDFDYWTGMQSVSAAVKDQLRVMLRHAPAAAQAALAPEIVGDKLKFYLTEVMLVGQKAR